MVVEDIRNNVYVWIYHSLRHILLVDDCPKRRFKDNITDIIKLGQAMSLNC